MVQKLTSAIVVLSLAACASPYSQRDTYDAIGAELARAVEANAKRAQPDAVSAALLPPLRIEMPQAAQPAEERFSLTFNNVPASQFFMAIVAGTRYNMLVHPDVTGTISANLKDVTVIEALDAIRELYGYDYKIEGSRIVIRSPSLQTQVFQVNYLTGSRRGTSDIRVTAGSVSESTTGGSTGTTSGTLGGQTVSSRDSSKLSTASVSDFWMELKAALDTIVGNKEGHSVVISPQYGVVVIRAMPEELRNVGAYLRAAQLSVGRQVILEAKILEVQLNDSFQTGINWATFASLRLNAANRVSAGFAAPGTTLTPLPSDGSASIPLSSTGSAAVNAITAAAFGVPASAGGSLFGFAFQASDFAALISFLESQGTVHVLSSPRIATLNNQKAVLKVGTDEFFVTNVSTTTTTATSTTTTPTVTLQPFFSGVVLDVTPQIDDSGNIILHVHPSVSQVSTVNKNINLGSGGALTLPLASSSSSETDSVVRGKDGQIFAIGGLMRQATMSDRSQIPGAGDLPGIGALFQNKSQVTQKRELVILLKPTIVQNEADWNQSMLDSQRRIQGLEPNRKPEYR
jgi:MSHA biogenesis protein MshL